MPASVTSVFSEPNDFQAALREDGVVSLLITGHGQFRARLTQVTLHRWRLWTSEEHLSRIAFVAVPANAILVLLPISSRVASICGGIGMRAGDIMMLGSGLQVHTRTDGPCRWGTLRLPARDLAQYGRALSGVGFAVPHLVVRWQPPPAARRGLCDLRRAAIRAAETRSGVLTDGEAAHGLEQQLIHALVECLSAGPVDEDMSAHRHREVLARFEGLLQLQPFLRVGEICAVAGVSERMLRSCREEHLGGEPEQLSSPPSDAAGAPRAAERRSGRGRLRRGRAAVRSTPPRPFRRELSSPLWQTAVRHFAAAARSGGAYAGPAACEVSMTN